MSEARVLILSLRNMERHVSRASGYEFEDLIAQVEDADLLCPDVTQHVPSTLERVVIEKVSRHRHVRIAQRPQLVPASVKRPYELFFVNVPSVSALGVLQSIQGWRSMCRRAVVWVDEFWRDAVHPKVVDILNQFDHVVLGLSETVPDLAPRLRGSCSYSPPGIDALGFCPVPSNPERSIDFYWMGRRSEVTHRPLREESRKSSFCYIHDTVRLQDMIGSHSEHRHMLATLARRSKYFVAYKSKIDAPEQTKGQEEFGMRYFEGAAAGAILVGAPPKNPNFPRYLDWERAGLTVPYNSPDVMELLRELESQPDRVAAMRRYNVETCLQRHDWLHRWQELLEKIGLEPSAKAKNRQEQLSERLDAVKTASLR